jgi:hypothetical protein
LLEEGSQTVVFQFAFGPETVRGELERFEAVEDKQSALCGNKAGKFAAAPVGILDGLAVVAEPVERVLEEPVGVALPFFIGALAVKRPRVDTLRSRPVGLAKLLQEPVY